jgi:dihydroxyacetone kinase-like protein
MNFELAGEMARAQGIPVESVNIDDDVAVQNSTWTAGRRGVGATILAEKICGAAAESQRSLAELRDLCQRVNASARSMGMALTSCTVPEVGKPTFDLPDNQMEVGVGIHGEPGRKRMKLRPADEIVELLMEPIFGDLRSRPTRCSLSCQRSGQHAVDRALHRLQKGAEIAKRAGLKIIRNLVGSYMTSLEMAGASITLLKLDGELAELWDAPVCTPALRKGI